MGVCVCRVQGCGGVQSVCRDPEEEAALQVEEPLIISISSAWLSFFRVCSGNSIDLFELFFFCFESGFRTKCKLTREIFLNFKCGFMSRYLCVARWHTWQPFTPPQWAGRRITVDVSCRGSRDSSGSSWTGSSRQSSTETDSRYSNDPQPWSSIDSDSSYQWTNPAPKPRQASSHSSEARGSGVSL